MRKLIFGGWGACLAALIITAAHGAEVTENLVVDGGIEQWRTTGPQDPWWNYLTVEWKAAAFARDEQGRVLTPQIVDQFYDTKLVKPETTDVHGGQRALRLQGQMYLRPSSPNAYQTRDGDIYLVRYWAKGSGQSLVHLHVYGDARVLVLETKGKPEPGRWTAIEERLQVVGPAPTSIFPRLWASDEILIDDVSVVRVMRPGERTLQEVPADLQERVAFAAPTGGAITPDGRLEEPGWGQAIACGGFRSHGDQMLFAPVQPTFRVLGDTEALYFGLEIPLPNAPQVLEELQQQPLLDAAGAPKPKSDTFSGRQSVELFLQAPGQSSYRQMVVSLDGYRYDSTGMEKTWDGQWQSALQVAADRWTLELRVPVRDLGVEATAPVEGWRLNVCCNHPAGGGTWAAVGNNYHNPDFFGKLIAQDFGAWRAAQPKQLQAKRTALMQAAGPSATRYTERLAALEAAAAPPGTDGTPRDWQAVTREYARLDYIGGAYRCLAEEVRFRGFFR